MAFRVGQKVVCVNDAENVGPWLEAAQPVLNAVYTVAAPPYVDDEGDLIVEIVELMNPYGGYLVGRFRPVVERKTDISVFTKMLTGSRKHATAE